MSGSSLSDAKTPFRPSSDDGSSCCSTTGGGAGADESDFMEGLLISYVEMWVRSSTNNLILNATLNYMRS